MRDTPISAGQPLLAEAVPQREVAGQQPLLQLAVGLLRPGRPVYQAVYTQVNVGNRRFPAIAPP